MTPPRRLDEEPHLRARLQTFVRAYGAPAPIGQLARWSEKVYPAVMGLSAQENDQVAARIRSLAVEVGAQVADATPCRRTVAVFFADQPQELLDAIRTKAPVFLGYHYPAQTRRLATFTGSVRAFYMTGTRGGDGALWLDDTRRRLPGGNPGSRLVSGITSEFAGVVVVADAAAVRRHEIAAVADYVAMLALAQTAGQRPCYALPTIMNLFGFDCLTPRAERLTSVDLAYLKALYTTSPRLRPDLQQAEVIAKMERSLRP